MQTSNVLAGLLALLIVGGICFGAGYYVAREEFQTAPHTLPVASVDDPTEPSLDQGEPLKLPEQTDPTDAPAGTPPKVTLRPVDKPAPPTSQPGTNPDASPDGKGTPVVEATPGTDPEKATGPNTTLEDLKKKLEDLKGLDKLHPEDIDKLMNGPKVDFTASVSGQVVDTGGVPVAGAEVRASYSENYASDGDSGSFHFVTSVGGGEGQVVATTDGGGYFNATISRKVSEKASLSASFTASADGYAESKKNTVTLKNGDNKEGVKLELRGAGGVTGRVIDAGGRGVEGVTVGLNTSGGSFFGGDSVVLEMGGGGKYSAQTDVGGNFTIEGVPEGRYKFKLSGAGYRQVSGPTEVDVKTGLTERASADFQVAITSSITATFVDADANPMQGWATFSFKDDAGKTIKQLSGPIGAKGAFAQNDPPAGTFQVEIRVWGFKANTVQATLLEGQRYDFGTLTLEVDDTTPSPGAYIPGNDD